MATVTLSAQKIGDHKWIARNVDGRGFSDVIALARLAGENPHSRLLVAYRTRRATSDVIRAVAERAALRTGGAYEIGGRAE